MFMQCPKKQPCVQPPLVAEYFFRAGIQFWTGRIFETGKSDDRTSRLR